MEMIDLLEETTDPLKDDCSDYSTGAIVICIKIIFFVFMSVNSLQKNENICDHIDNFIHRGCKRRI